MIADHSVGKTGLAIQSLAKTCTEYIKDTQSTNMNTNKLEQAYLAAGFTPSKAKRWANRPVKRPVPFQKQPIVDSAEWKLRVLAASELVKGVVNLNTLGERQVADKAQELYFMTNRAWRRARVFNVIRLIKKASR